MRAAADRIETARTALETVVETYLADAGASTLTGVTAASKYDAAGVDSALSPARTRTLEARDRVVTNDQQRTVDRMFGCWRFLSRASRTQRQTQVAYNNFDSARRTLAGGSAASTAIRTMDARRKQALLDLDDLRDAAKPTDPAVLDSLDETTYEEKVAQFEAELGVMASLKGPLESFQSALTDLQDARQTADDDDASNRDVAEAAATAEASFDDVVSKLESLGSDFSGYETDPFQTPVSELADAATEFRDEAAEIPEENE
ncbi:hypothetical protein BRC83_10190 [Halobacteriales archaeon QS_1_68_17]|nr:MAG: hypothetical protein BRC83_10190 [Halobacteriales archaeon QS_1_68_17]